MFYVIPIVVLMYNQQVIRAAPQKNTMPIPNPSKLCPAHDSLPLYVTRLRTHSQFLYTSAFSNDTPTFLGESKFAWNSRVPSDVSIYKQ